MTDRLDAIVGRLEGRDVEQRLRALADLRRELGALESELVVAAVSAGWSWTRIGRALGVTKQAAHSRHGKTAAVSAARERARPRVTAPPPPGRQQPPPPAGRDVREAVRLARAEATALGQRVVGTEHLLVGVLRMEDHPAAGALRSLGVTAGEARSALEPTLEVSVAERPVNAGSGRGAAVSPLARQVLERSLREALSRSGGRLSASTLLAEVLADRDGGAARTLTRLGVAPQAVIARLAGGDDA
ncbi:MAG: hypothetical protein NVSMB25_05960 [Thermoleophilaceae bacterium]